MLLVKRKSNLSNRAQCEYLGIPKSCYYHTLKDETKENLDIMKSMDDTTIVFLTMQSMLKYNLIHTSKRELDTLL